MFVVYWIEIQKEVKTPKCKEFDLHEMTRTLEWMESLRKIQREIGGIGHIVMSSENPNSVGLSGVDVTDASYNWKKRRH
jgi:hypothetical protein